MLFGRCAVVNPTLATLEVPCQDGLLLEVYDASAKPVGKTLTAEGRFTVAVPKPTSSYFLKLKSPGFRQTTERLGPFAEGEEILLRLDKDPSHPR